VRDDRPIDGIDQTDLLLGGSDRGRRDALLTFVGPELVAVRWKQFCTYESDPREEHNIGAQYEWVISPALKIVEEYKASLRRDPNAPAASITGF
jgi:hypothetical protein